MASSWTLLFASFNFGVPSAKRSDNDDVIKWKHTGKFPAQRPVTRNFDVFFDLRLNKRLSKQS